MMAEIPDSISAHVPVYVKDVHNNFQRAIDAEAKVVQAVQEKRW